MHAPKASAQDLVAALRTIPLWDPNRRTAILRFIKEEDDLLLFSHREQGPEKLIFVFVAHGFLWTNDNTDHVEGSLKKAGFLFMVSKNDLPRGVHKPEEVRIHFRRALSEHVSDVQEAELKKLINSSLVCDKGFPCL
jgi:hypothetical protein